MSSVPVASLAIKAAKPVPNSTRHLMEKNRLRRSKAKEIYLSMVHINCKEAKWMCKRLGETVRKGEPGKVLLEKKNSWEINFREFSTLRCAKCLVESCIFPPFSKSSVPRQLCVPAQRFSKYKFLHLGSISAFQPVICTCNQEVTVKGSNAIQHVYMNFVIFNLHVFICLQKITLCSKPIKRQAPLSRILE